MGSPHHCTVRLLRIASYQRLLNTKYGNPRYSIIFTDGTAATTEPDIADAYGIENPEMKGLVNVTFGRYGITHITPAHTPPEGK
jgi:hypothetical protein